MKSKIIIIVLAVFLITGCKKFLVVTPETNLSSATFFQSESDFKQAVNGAYAPLRTIVNGPAYILGEMHSDNTYYFRNILFGAVDPTENVADFALPSSGGLTTNANVLTQYRQDYLIISRVNQILTTIDAVDFSADSKNNLKGQALFLRAFAYFELVRYFGKVPLHLTPVTNRAESALPLSSVDSIYLQIVKDADAASKLLLNKAKQEPGRATSGAAKTLLANAYMQQKKWALAEPLLKDVIANDGYALMPDYTNAFSGTSDNKNNQESVFEVQFMEGSAGYNGTLIYNFLPRPMTAGELQPITGVSNPQSLSGEGNNAPTPDLIAAYEPNDKRKDISIGSVTLSGSLRDNKVYPYIKKFAKPHALFNNTGNNWPIYRYAEVLLLLAESLNEQGKSTEAATYLNQVRARAGLAASAATDMRDAILKERRVELAFENKRWFDLVRSGTATAVITAYGNRIKANPLNYYFPNGAVPPNNAFTNIKEFYELPADEAALSPFF